MSPGASILLKFNLHTLLRKCALPFRITVGKGLNLPVRQVEPTHLEIVFCEHQEAMEVTVNASLQLVLTGDPYHMYNLVCAYCPQPLHIFINVIS